MDDVGATHWVALTAQTHRSKKQPEPVHYPAKSAGQVRGRTLGRLYNAIDKKNRAVPAKPTRG
jgi:hypothetical protein